MDNRFLAALRRKCMLICGPSVNCVNPVTVNQKKTISHKFMKWDLFCPKPFTPSFPCRCSQASLLGLLKLTGPKVLTLSTVQAQSKWIIHSNELINTYYGLVGTKVRTEPREHRSTEQWRVGKKSTLRLIQIASTLPQGFPYSRIQFTVADWRGLDPGNRITLLRP